VVVGEMRQRRVSNQWVGGVVVAEVEIGSCDLDGGIVG